MAQYNIPGSEIETLKKISELSDSVFAELSEVLKKTAETTDQLRFASKISDQIKSVGAPDVKAFVKTISSLYAVKAASGKTAEAVAIDIKETVDSAKPADFGPEKTSVLQNRIRAWLLIDSSLSLFAKTFEVMASHDKVFCGVRIFSDIRPIFSEQPDSISASVPVHTINISYHHSGRHEEFFAAMSVSDLAALRKALERAEKKNATLKDLINKSGIRYLEEGQ